MFAELLTYDCYLREKMKSRPDFAKSNEEQYKEVVETLQEAIESGEFKLEGMEGMPMRKLIKLVHIERFSIDIENTVKAGTPIYEDQVIFFNYNERNPLNHDAKTILWKR